MVSDGRGWVEAAVLLVEESERGEVEVKVGGFETSFKFPLG